MAKKGKTKSTSNSPTTANATKNKSVPPGKGAATAATVVAPTPTYEQIAARAEEIWRQHGCPSGQDDYNWHEAERQLRKEMSR